MSEEQINEEDEFITDDKWEVWLRQVVQVLSKYENTLDIVSFMGQIKQKIEDCSRCYVAIWTIEMLFKSNIELQGKMSPDIHKQFDQDIKIIKRSWDTIMQPIRGKRQDFICEKCIDFFFTHYEDASKVTTRQKIDNFAGTNEQKWNKISKMCFEAGLHSNAKYQQFIDKLTNEMVKY